MKSPSENSSTSDKTIETSDTAVLEAEIDIALKSIRENLQTLSQSQRNSILTGKLVKAAMYENGPADDKLVEQRQRELSPLLPHLKNADNALPGAGFRTDQEQDENNLWLKYLNSIDTEHKPGISVETIEEFIDAETATILDVALVRSAVKHGALATVDNQSSEEVTKFLLGDNSSFAQRMAQLAQRDSHENTKASALVLTGAVMLTLEATVIALAAIKLDSRFTITTATIAALYAALAVLIGVWGGQRLAKNIKNPDPHSLESITANYNKMDIPNNVQEFAEQTWQILDLINKIQLTTDPQKRAAIMRQLKPLVEDANHKVKENMEIFGKKAVKPDPQKTPAKAKKVEIIMQEFEEEHQLQNPPATTSVSGASTVNVRVAALSQVRVAPVQPGNDNGIPPTITNPPTTISTEDDDQLAEEIRAQQEKEEAEKKRMAR